MNGVFFFAERVNHTRSFSTMEGWMGPSLGSPWTISTAFSNFAWLMAENHSGDCTGLGGTTLATALTVIR